jgi:DNA-damage-inducible protein J
MAMNKTAVIHARIEPDTKREAERLLKKLGMSPTEAIRLFYRQICLRGGLPFPVLVPNALTEKILDDSAKGEGVLAFETLDEMFANWDE